MFHRFTVIQMLIELLRLCTEIVTLAKFGWRNSFYACRFGPEFGQSAFICKLRHGCGRDVKASRITRNSINFVKF